MPLTPPLSTKPAHIPVRQSELVLTAYVRPTMFRTLASTHTTWLSTSPSRRRIVRLDLQQVCFAIETVVDEICDTMGWDKLQFRLDNASTEGSRNGNGVMFNRIGLVEMLEQARDSDHWNSATRGCKAGHEARSRDWRSGFWMNGGGKSTVDLMLQDDGTVAMNEGSQDIGDSRASIAMQAAEVLGLDAHDVSPSVPSTDEIGYTGDDRWKPCYLRDRLCGLGSGDRDG